MSNRSINDRCKRCGEPRGKYAKFCSHACYSASRKDTLRVVLTSEQESDIARRYVAGETSYELGSEYGIAPMTILKVVRRQGSEIRKGGNQRFGPRSGENHAQWKGGRRVHSDGYVRVYLHAADPLAVMRGVSSHVAEHRLLMARILGRPLLRTETVHHINGDRADNRLENLQLRRGHHGPGQTHVCADCGSYNIVEVELPD